ncbi:unnamed protein product, partial [Rotaria magnacalcarata]
MTSKANKNRDDGPTLSSSISYSPCNLRRNQPQAGVIAKRTKSVKSKTKEFFGEDEQLDESSETDEMECSDNEQTPRTVQNIEEVKNNKASVWKHFDQLDENVYMCQLCYK